MLFGGLASAGTARAQIAASASFVTLYDLRGVALDDGRPDAQISLSYDHPSGAYAGISGLVDKTVHDGIKPFGYVGYLGFAFRLPDGPTLDLGLSNADLTLSLPAVVGRTPTVAGRNRRYNSNYAELYGGVAVQEFRAHLYLSPDYLGQGVRTAYLDLDQEIRLTRWLRLYVHGGALTPLAAPAPKSGADREKFDLGAGAVWIISNTEISFGWTALSLVQNYPVSANQRQSRFVMSFTKFF